VDVHVHTPALTHRTHTATPGAEAAASAGRGSPLLWLGAAAVLFFLVPFVGADWLALQPDLYYLGYFTVAVAFFAIFVAVHASALRILWTEHLWQSLLIGALTGAALAIGIFNQVATSRCCRQRSRPTTPAMAAAIWLPGSQQGGGSPPQAPSR
jgi:hypothetical protein